MLPYRTHSMRRQSVHSARSGNSRAFSVLMTIAGVATAGWALEETEKPAEPAQVTTSLTSEAFASLGPNWTEWSDGTVEAVGKLVANTPGDAAAQREAIDGVKARIATIDKALRDARYSKISLPLTGLSRALTRRVELSEAVLETLALDPKDAQTKRVKAKTDQVTAAIANLGKSLEKIPGGKAWLPYLKAEDLSTALKADATGEAAVAAAKATQAKLAARNTLEDQKQKDFLNRPAFVNLESAVDQYLSAVENPPGADYADKLREQIKALVGGLETWEAGGQSSAAAQARQAYTALRKLAADGGDKLSAVLQKYYFNYNVRMVASEEFITRLLTDTHTEQGPVVDYVLGANVSGNQTTNTRVTADLKPSNSDARFDLVLSGSSFSNTVGVTDQATVYTQGNHAFRAAKDVRFDGTKFRTSPATINVNPNNTTTGVATQFSGGLFGGIADRIASREVEARRGQSEAIAASRLQDRVLPRFNQEVNDAFVKAEKDLQTEMYDHLRATGLYPDAMQFQTTDRELRASTRLMRDKEMGGGAAPLQYTTPTGATLFLHESELNNGADRLELTGKTMTDEEFRKHLEDFFSKALNRKFTIDPPEKPAPAEGEEADEKPPGIFVFADADPIRFQLRDGVFHVVFRTGFKKDDGTVIPQHIITVPLRFEVQGNKIHIVRERVEVAAAAEGSDIPTRGVIRRKIENTIPDRLVDGTFKLQGTRQTVNAAIKNIRIVDGWAVVNVN